MNIKERFRFGHEWFLLLAPAFLVLHGYARYPAAISRTDIFLLFLQYSCWSLAIALAASFFLSFRKAALYSCMLVIFNTVFGSIYEFVKLAGTSLFFTRFSFILPVVFVCFLLLFIFLKKTKWNFHRTTSFLNLLFLLFIAIELFRFGTKAWKREALSTDPTLCADCPKPDVYLVITDGYGGHKQLKEYLGFNNAPFTDSLKRMGFYVADSSISNYAATSSSMATLLNMEYVGIDDEEDVHLAFDKNKVAAFFQSLNYQVKNYSFFKIAGQFPEQPSMYFKTGTQLITRHNFTSHVKQIVHNVLFSAGWKDEINRTIHIELESAEKGRRRDSITMERLLTEARTNEKTPRFVYTHFLMPHPPYLFDKRGRTFRAAGSPETRYIEYLQYTNEQLLKALNAILDHAPEEPIILLLSDHGYRDDSAPVPTPMRFYNLAAIHLPSKDYRNYYKGVSNVNQFRILLNGQFGQRLPLLRDSIAY